MRALFPPFRHITLQRKLLTLVIPLLIVTVGITGLYSYYIASGEVIDKLRQSQLNMAIKTKDQLDYFAKSTLSFSNYLFLNPAVQGMVLNGDTPQRRDQVFKSLLPLMVTGETIQSLIVYPSFKEDVSGQPFAITQTGIASAISFDGFTKTRYYERLTKTDSGHIWDMFYPSDYILPGDYHHKIVLIKPYKNYYNYARIGLLIIGMDADKLSKTLYHDNEDAAQFIMNEQGTILAATDIQWIGKPITLLPFFDQQDTSTIHPERGLALLKKDNKYIVSDSVSDITDWHTVVIQDRSKLVLELKHIGSVTFSIMAVVTLITIIVSWVIARIITNPMKKLMLSMRALQTGDFTQRVHFNGNDEIGRLGHLYNTMVGRIKTLIDDVYASRLKQKEAELKALQSQINPHFLYNTLNMINWSAVQKGDKEISEMVVSLSQVFRLSLNSGNDLVALEQELELVRNYLFLQKKRFTTRFNFEIELDPAISHFRMPKLLLQPLVENAIIHAIEPSGGNGHIHIRAYTEATIIILEVADNGPGMPEEQVRRLNQSRVDEPMRVLQTNVPHSGMALSNIKERLALFYEQAEFEIVSREGLGTRVQIRINQGGTAHDA
ncbi:two-component system sensor histidine kinase YesM [Paenibacillus endophyticus]|uniref:histidine kinase n=1 Tax=Paenibacillus endophyticus TaxID=1294268 RepID=A0A7W5CAH0_9BACL|nr:sensor histidine kinase [Paenibacillus endophyticus]MBB3154108.1 two-component system sensor histidine kinase YesM [Paenibacillus endophyticus]